LAGSHLLWCWNWGNSTGRPRNTPGRCKQGRQTA